MNRIKTFVILSALATLLFSCADSDPSTGNAENAAPNNASQPNTESAETPIDELAVGRKVYLENCAKCHKEDGSGGKTVVEGEEINAEDLTTDAMIKEPDAEYVEYIEEGIADEGMPAFKDVLDESEISAVIKFIREELQKK